MDKIYIEGKLPKCCLMCTLECPEEQRCVDGFTRDCENCDVSDRPKTCPLKPLSDRLKEEQKKVMQELKKMMPTFFGKSEFDWEGFYDYLDQIERGD